MCEELWAVRINLLCPPTSCMSKEFFYNFGVHFWRFLSAPWLPPPPTNTLPKGSSALRQVVLASVLRIARSGFLSGLNNLAVRSRQWNVDTIVWLTFEAMLCTLRRTHTLMHACTLLIRMRRLLMLFFDWSWSQHAIQFRSTKEAVVRERNNPSTHPVLTGCISHELGNLDPSWIGVYNGHCPSFPDDV